MSGPQGSADQSPAAEPEDPTPEEEWRMRVGAELTTIRQELTLIRQAVTDEPPQEEDETSETWTCRCGAAFDDKAAARDHATETHNAPRDGWQDIVSRE
jgi:hypothetical protein